MLREYRYEGLKCSSGCSRQDGGALCLLSEYAKTLCLT